jgi:hypothetical protein
MQVTSIDEARALVGRTFDHTWMLTVVRVFRNEAVGCDYVELGRHGEEVGWIWPLDRFSKWFEGATEVVGELLSDDWFRSRGGKWDDDGFCWRFRHSWNTVNVRVNGQCWITASCTFEGKVSLHRRLQTCEEFTELCRLIGMPLGEVSE